MGGHSGDDRQGDGLRCYHRAKSAVGGRGKRGGGGGRCREGDQQRLRRARRHTSPTRRRERCQWCCWEVAKMQRMQPGPCRERREARRNAYKHTTAATRTQGGSGDTPGCAMQEGHTQHSVAHRYRSRQTNNNSITWCAAYRGPQRDDINMTSGREDACQACVHPRRCEAAGWGGVDGCAA